MKKLLLPILFISLLSCSSDDDEVLTAPQQQECYKITYQKTADWPPLEISREKTNQPSTNGYVDYGGYTFFEIKCF